MEDLFQADSGSPNRCVDRETPSTGSALKVPLPRPWPLHGPANLGLAHICFSIPMSVAFFPFEVPNHYPEHPLLALAEDICGEGFRHFGQLLIFLGPFHVYMLFNFSLIFSC